MKKPTLKEVQEHFKNAYEVESLFNFGPFKLQQPIRFECGNYYDVNDCKVHDDKEGYSKIITKNVKSPTLKEIKEHFKNAKEVRCLIDGKIYKLGKIKIDKKIFTYPDVFWVMHKSDKNSIKLTDKNQFAEIISYKKPKFKYLEKVIASDYEDFSTYIECRYACKNILEGYVVFSEFDSVFVFKYIKKIS